MVKVIRVANAGDEKDFENFSERKANLRSELEKELEQLYAEKLSKLDAILQLLSHDEEIEVPDEVAETETAEETVGE